jgi:hypothetical protein
VVKGKTGYFFSLSTSVLSLTGDLLRVRHSVRVVFNGRRWWYQPQALLSESSGLTESPTVWFLRTILRAHSYDHTTLEPLCGKPLTTSSWQVGDIVAPRTNASNTIPTVHTIFGRIVAETSMSNSPLAPRSRDSGSVLVEFVEESFGEATGVLSGDQPVTEGSGTLYTRRIRLNRLQHSRCIDATHSVEHSPPYSNADSLKGESSPMDVSWTSSKQPHPVVMISSKLRSLIGGVAELNVASIEELCAECGRNVGALASSFSGGLPEMYLAALEKCQEQLSKNQDGHSSLSHAVVALGDLSICIANQIFRVDGIVRHDTNELASKYQGSEALKVRYDIEARPPSIRATMHQSHDQGDRERRDVTGLRSIPGVRHSVVADLNHGGRLSSMQQRRSMLLALVSRARRGSADDRAVVELARDVSMGPVHNSLADGSRFSFAGGLPSDRSWDDFGRVPRAGGHSENTMLLDSFSNNPSLNQVDTTPGLGGNEASVRVLDSIVRGQGEVLHGSRSGTGGNATLSMIRSLITNGLLGNRLKWVQATVAAQSERNVVGSSGREKVAVLQNAVDDDGTPLLMLAISLGCSEAIIRLLISQGAPVSEKELKTAALTNQPIILSVLLDHCLYVPGFVDHQLCSPAVVCVLEAAAAGQTELESKMRDHAEEFFPRAIRKLLQLGLASRRVQTKNALMCSKAVTFALVGNVLLNALREHQSKSSPLQQPGTSEASVTNQANPSDTSRFPVEVPSQRFETASGLLNAIPGSILKKALFQRADVIVSPLVTYLLLVENHLCNQGIDNAGVGLALFSIILKHFPSLTATALFDRFGFAELVSFHESYATSRLSQISSQVSSLPAAGRTENMSQTFLDTDRALCGSPGSIRCPRHHPATLHITRHSSFRCDLCGKAVERGRPMHGCRECDWDACEQCTDKAEGGIVKWLKIKETALECEQLLLAGEVSMLGESFDSTAEAIRAVIDGMGWNDHLSELNILCTRLLQRDPEALKQLSSMLETPGCVTTHQFVTVVLPSLHSSLVGRSDIFRPQGFGPRCKKARVVFPGRDAGESCPAVSTINRQFCKLAFDYLVADDPSTKSIATESRATIEGGDDGETQRDEDNEDEEDEESDDEAKEKQIPENKPSQERPELVRRLHQVLSFYETISMVKLAPASNQRSAHGGSTGGDLQALTQPLEITLAPTIFRRASAETPLRHLTVLVEPLTTMDALERIILCTFRILNPSYVTFCRRYGEI